MATSPRAIASQCAGAQFATLSVKTESAEALRRCNSICEAKAASAPDVAATVELFGMVTG